MHFLSFYASMTTSLATQGTINHSIKSIEAPIASTTRRSSMSAAVGGVEPCGWALSTPSLQLPAKMFSHSINSLTSWTSSRLVAKASILTQRLRWLPRYRVREGPATLIQSIVSIGMGEHSKERVTHTAQAAERTGGSFGEDRS